MSATATINQSIGGSTMNYPVSDAFTSASASASAPVSAPATVLASPYADLVTLLGTGQNPSLCVFDLDYTIWPYDCDKDVIAPFTLSPYGGVTDRYGRPSNTFTDVPAIIAALVDANIPIAYASRNPSAASINQLLRAIQIAPKTKPHVRTLWDALSSPALFHAYSSHGYGSGKARHFAAIKAVSGIEFKDMLFFDDLIDNITHAQRQGTTCVHLGRRGLTFEAMIAGIVGWRQRSDTTSASSASSSASSSSSSSTPSASASASAVCRAIRPPRRICTCAEAS